MYFALQFERSGDRRSALWMGICASAAFLTRNESAITTALIFAFLIWRVQREKNIRRHLGPLVASAAIFAVCIVGVLGFQWSYYGEFLPNTYTLKVSGIALGDRVRNGAAFSARFVLYMSVMIIIAVIGMLRRPRAREVLLFSCFGVALAYQIYVGGDAWPPYWRFTTPTTPFLTTVFVIAVDRLVSRAQQRFSIDARILLPLVVAAGFAVSVRPFLSHIVLRSFPTEVEANQNRLRIALALREVMKEDASIGVNAAGVIPYYSDDVQPRRAMDFLGKIDRNIASLSPHISPYVNFWTMMYRPGHNKFDAIYSIQQLQPDFIETEGKTYGQDALSPQWVAEHYVRVTYKGVDLVLRRDSKNVRWELLPKTMQAP